MTSFEPDRMLLMLAEHGVDFVVIGGIAAIAYGSQQMTFDLDILYQESRENRERLAGALGALDAKVWMSIDATPMEARRLRPWQMAARDAACRVDADLLGRWRNHHFVTPIGVLDCMVTVPGAPSYVDALQRAMETSLEEHARIYIVDLDDLIAMKRAVGRPKDLLAVEELLEIRKLLESQGGQKHEGSDDRQ